MLTKGVLSSGSEIPYGRGGATPLSGKPATKPFSLPAKSLEAFQGTYWIEATQAMRKIVLDKDKRDPREESILLSNRTESSKERRFSRNDNRPKRDRSLENGSTSREKNRFRDIRINRKELARKLHLLNPED
jgi:hypothetical protein